MTNSTPKSPNDKRPPAQPPGVHSRDAGAGHNRVPQTVAALLLLALLLTTYLGGRRAQEPARDPASGSAPVPLTRQQQQAALARSGFWLHEVAAQAGIRFTHQPPTLDPRLAHIAPEVAAMGASVAVGDADGDGWDDLFVTDSREGSLCHLYRNNHDGTFTDVAAQMGVADLNRPGTGACMGAVWGDYDNDGREDLLVYKWGRCELFHNDGGKRFTRVTDRAGLPAWANISTALWLDWDRDGHLDLLLCGYWPDDVDLQHLKSTRIMPDSFEFANNGGRKWLLRGRGDGTFEDVTAQMGLDSHRWTLAATAADLDGSGWPSIVLANDYGVAEIWANAQGRRFTNVAPTALYGDALARGAKSGMNASVGDVFNQGRFALYISNISEQGQLMQGNDLWTPDDNNTGKTQDPGGKSGTVPTSHLGPGSSLALHYTNMAHDLGVELGGWSFGAQWGDLNNDGTLDLYLTNGYISADRQQTYWYDFSKVSGGHSTIIGDAANWPAIGQRSHSGYQSKCVWQNDGAGKLTDVAKTVGANDLYDGRAVALADLWNRGCLDVLVANQRAPFLLYKNTVDPRNHWIEFDLKGKAKPIASNGRAEGLPEAGPALPGGRPAPYSNTSAIGAQVQLYWSGKTQVQEVSGGSGFCAQNQRRLHFGLGRDPILTKAVIRWPSGIRQTLDAHSSPALTPDTRLHVVEP